MNFTVGTSIQAQSLGNNPEDNVCLGGDVNVK